MIDKKENKKCLQWGNGPVIESIRITPEQAVLACCNAGAQAVRNFGGTQCIGTGTLTAPCDASSGVKATPCTTLTGGVLAGAAAGSS